MKDFILNQIKESYEAKIKLFNDEVLINKISQVSELIIDAYKNGKKVLIAGNGGSAADAQHMVGEFVSKFYFDRLGLSALALTTDTSVLTAIGNDYGFDRIFARQIQANGVEGDVFIGISTSGNSPNILKAVEMCKEKNIQTVSFVGAKECDLDDVCDIVIKIPSSETPRIQESHILVEHIICAIVEEEIFGKGF